MPRLSRSITRAAGAVYDISAPPIAAAGGALLVQEPLTSPAVASFVGWALAAAFPAVWLSGANRQVWRFVTLREGVALGLAAVGAVGAALTAAVLTTSPDGGLLNTAVAAFLLLMLLWLAPRYAVRTFRDGLPRAASPGVQAEPVLLAGEGEAVEAFLRANSRHRRFGVLGLLSEDRSLHHRRLGGAPVLGSLADLGRVLDRLQARGLRPPRLILAGGGYGKDELAAALKQAADHGLTLSRAPDPANVLPQEPDRLQPLEINDLLSRPPATLDGDAMAALVERKVVLITGAGGSIGSELVRQTAGLNPSLLVLVENNEHNLYAIDLECARSFPNVRRLAALCDVRDRDALERWFAASRPDLVFHAAALKHVPMLEEHPEEAVLTNVLGTRNVAELSTRHGVKAAVLVSTDKAVNPTNIMGATKRCAEILCQGYDQLRRAEGGGTRHLAVRFGNVLGSSGSVVPLFTRQIAEGGPVTVTHPDMTRYFMTIPEAVQLILQATATALASDEEPGGVYVLDMGEPVRILDLAERVIQLSGRRPYLDVPIRIVGLRPGEKLHEELAHADERLGPSGHPGVFFARPRVAPLPAALAVTDRMVKAARAGDRSGMIQALHDLAPEFQPPRTPSRTAAEDDSTVPAQPFIRAVT